MARKSRYRLTRLWALTMILLSGPVLALGLGDIQVRSHLDQPFSAVIPLTINSPSDLNGLSVSLGSAAAFRRAGIEPTDALSSLHFEVNTHGSQSVIDVTSQQPVREPYLNFLVQAQWNAGTLLREYTVLMNPPGANDAAPAPAAEAPPPAPVTAADSQEAQQPVVQPAPMPAPQPTPRPKRQARKRAPIASTPQVTSSSTSDIAAIGTGTRYGPVNPGETFWSIATRVRPNAGLTMDQVLLAIYDGNRSAFEQGHFNGLMKGRMLNIPSADAMRSVAAPAARSRVMALRRGREPAAPPSPVEKAGTAAATIAPGVSKSPPESAQGPAETPSAETLMGGRTSNPKPAAASSSGAAAAEKNAQQPAVASAEAGQATAGATATLPSSSASSGATETQPATEKPVMATAAPATVAAPPVIKTKPVAKPTVGAGRSTKTSNNLIAVIDQFRWPILGFLVLVVLAFLLVRSRRQQSAADTEGEASPPRRRIGSARDPMKTVESDEGGIEAGDAEITAVAVGAAAVATASSLTEAPVQVRPLQEESEGFDPATAGDAKTFDLAADGAEDPLAEADFHLAYGLFDEAILLLENALAKTPHRVDLQLKLAECYAAAGKPLEFQTLAEELESRTTPDEWAQICEQGRKLCPGVALFSGGEHSAPVAEPEPTAPEVDDDHQAEGVSDPIQTPGDNIIDFEPMPTEAAKTPEPPRPAEKSESFDLSDFDSFGGGDETAPDNRVDFKLDDLDLSDAMTPSETGPGPAAKPRSGNDDEFATKLDLARAYSDMGDNDAARSLLDEVMQGGSEALKAEAEALTKQLAG